MSKPGCILYFGVQLDGDEPQFRIYDDSAATWYEYTIPKGLYFYNHPESKKNIVSVMNVLMTGFVTLSRQNDRQLKFDMAATADDFQLLETDNRDCEKLAYMLGLYDNSGNYLYHTAVNVTDNWITQCTLSTWYSAGGRMFETSTERGFAAYEAQYSAAQSGKTAGISTGKRNLIQPLTITSIDADDMRVINVYGYQTTLGTTEDADWTTSFWQAYNPDLHAAVFYASLTNRSGVEVEGEWYITDPIGPEQCKPTIANVATLFDLSIRASFVEIEQQDKYLYFGSGLNACLSYPPDAAWGITSDMWIILDVYITSFQTGATFFTLRNTSTSDIPVLLRLNPYAATTKIYWYQGSVALGFELYDTTITPPQNQWVRVMYKRTGSTGANAVTGWCTGSADASVSPTKTPGSTNISMGVMNQYSCGASNVYGYLGKVQLANRYPTAAEWASAKLMVDPEPDTMLGVWMLQEQGGNFHLDSSGNGRILTSVNASWAVIP